MKKFYLILFTLVITISITGCTLKKEKEISTLEKINKEELEVLENLVLSQEEEQVLLDQIKENETNGVTSDNLSGDYYIINQDETVISKIKIENVLENYTTKGDYSYLALKTTINEVPYMVFYGYIPEDKHQETMINLSSAFIEVPLKTIEFEDDYFVSNPNISSKKDVVITDELDINYYGNAIVYNTQQSDQLFIYFVCTLPTYKDITNNTIDNFTNISLY